MSNNRKWALYLAVIALAVTRFVVTANDSPDTIVSPGTPSLRTAPVGELGVHSLGTGGWVTPSTGAAIVAQAGPAG